LRRVHDRNLPRVIKLAARAGRIEAALLSLGAQYKFYVEAATVAVLCYVGFVDLRSFKIRNESILLLLVLYGAFAMVARSPFEILLNFTLSLVVFVVLLWFYGRGAIGGGDVKLVSVVCLWIDAHCALLFSILLLGFVGLHVAATRWGLVSTQMIGTRQALPYAPAVAAALITLILLGCV
jgi:Flp pilus assembly protein protease CpaA